MRKLLVLFSVLSVLVGCNEGTTPSVDGGAGDGGGSDARALADAGDDGGESTTCAGAPCGAGHACVRDVCLATCGADASGWDGALAPGLTPIGSVCRTVDAIAVSGSEAYDVTHATSGTTTTFTLSRWATGSESPTVSVVGTASYEASASEMVFAGGYLALSTDGMRAVFGYTTDQAGYVGGLFDMATAGGTAVEVGADGNFDATFRDTTDYFVNGGIGGAPGVYAGHAGGTTLEALVAGLGDASGSVRFWVDQSVLLAGGSSFGGTTWADGSTSGSRVVVLTETDLASATVLAANDLPQLDMPSSFALLSGGRAASVHYDASFAVDGIEVRTLSVTASEVSVSSPTAFVSGGDFSAITAAGDGAVLAFGGGLLFVR